MFGVSQTVDRRMLMETGDLIRNGPSFFERTGAEYDNVPRNLLKTHDDVLVRDPQIIDTSF